MTHSQIISWLLDGDVSLQYQTTRDLLNVDQPGLQNKIAAEGWGAMLLASRKKTRHWGQGFYQPKWTSSHYTLLDLKNLNISPENTLIRETLSLIFQNTNSPDGGIPCSSGQRSDVCVNGMLLNYACYFGVPEPSLKSVIDFILSQKMSDGGFNCRSNSSGAVHSSLHTTLSVLEGIFEFIRHGYQYRLEELISARSLAEEFILMHRLFRSDKTGQIIKSDFLKFHYPTRWKYDILKALDYFQLAGIKYDPRMEDALTILVQNRTRDGLWKLAARHTGQSHFEMEPAGKPSRWNTLRALRILKHFKTAEFIHSD